MDEFDIVSEVGKGTTVTHDQVAAQLTDDTTGTREDSAMTSTTPDSLAGAEATAGDDLLLPELVAHLRENRTQLRQEWANRITDARPAQRR